LGVPSTLVDGRDPENFARAMQPNTKVVFIETPTNPTLELVDIKAVADIAHAHGAKLIVDNVFATARSIRSPLELGADLVTYSATKHIDGQGRVMGGIVLGSREIIEGDVHTFLRHTGATLSPFNAWVLLKGLETYALRVERMTDSAEKVAAALAGHPKVNRVIYPHHPSHPQYELAQRQMKRGSTLLAIDVKAGRRVPSPLSDNLGGGPDFQQSGAMPSRSSPIRAPPPMLASPRRSASKPASPRASCASRSVSKTPTI
jgi:O-succinylhomoserine sulfhydrylase